MNTKCSITSNNNWFNGVKLVQRSRGGTHMGQLGCLTL